MPPKRGTWSAVDYARPEIRDLARRTIAEVAANYDLDGVTLDRDGTFRPVGDAFDVGAYEWDVDDPPPPPGETGGVDETGGDATAGGSGGVDGSGGSGAVAGAPSWLMTAWSAWASQRRVSSSGVKLGAVALVPIRYISGGEDSSAGRSV